MSRTENVLTKRVLTDVKSLLTKKTRDAERKFIVEGWKSVEEAVNSGVKCDTILYDPHNVEEYKLLSLLERSSRAIYQAKAKEIESISDMVTSQGIIAVLPQFNHIAAFSSVLRKSEALIIALDAINDPGNLGTIIRACDWFGVDAVLIGKHSVDMYNPKVVRSTMGSLFHLPVLTDVDLTESLAECRNAGCTMYSTELQKSEDVRTIAFSKRSVIVIGSESHGVSENISVLADKRIKIPQFGKAESLNAAMACSVILSYLKL
ncbi:MAG: RNA methyltransferase [Bacteriovoracaceae bacterium]